MYPGFNLKRIEEEYIKNQDFGIEHNALDIKEKFENIMKWLYARSRIKSNVMLFMIMYDIENNKVRTQIAKYLTKKGCMRIQKSVYLAKSSPAVMKEISNVLREINEIYHNHDSIFVLPVPEEKFSNMKVIGKNVEFEILTKPKNVLFF